MNMTSLVKHGLVLAQVNVVCFQILLTRKPYFCLNFLSSFSNLKSYYGHYYGSIEYVNYGGYNHIILIGQEYIEYLALDSTDGFISSAYCLSYFFLN